MAGGGDFSGCFEISSGYGNLYRFDSGKYGIYFGCTGDGVERLWAKDPTVDVTNAVLVLHYAQLSCSSTSVGLYDGSDGEGIVSIRGSDVSCQGHPSETWDFGKDGLVCMTAENTKSLSVCAGDGLISGFVKVSWGTRPQ